MSTSSKRIIFWTLIILFVIHSVFVFTYGTEKDKGKNFLTGEAKKGKLLFQKHNCIACHQFYGLGGYMGPDLTNVISAKGKGADYARAFISGGTQRMPNFHMTEEEVNNLISFLKYVNKTGISPIINFDINVDGTINSENDK